MRYRVYHSAPEVVAQAREVGVFGDVAKRLSRMARRSAPYQGVRRFYEFLLTLDGDRVVWVERIEEHVETA